MKVALQYYYLCFLIHTREYQVGFHLYQLYFFNIFHYFQLFFTLFSWRKLLRVENENIILEFSMINKLFHLSVWARNISNSPFSIEIKHTMLLNNQFFTSLTVYHIEYSLFCKNYDIGFFDQFNNGCNWFYNFCNQFHNYYQQPIKMLFIYKFFLYF